MRTSESIAKVAAALVAAQKEMGGSVQKDAKNPFFKSNYATLNAALETVMPTLNKHGLVVLQPTVTKDGKQYVATTIMHESGEFISSETEIVTKAGANAQETGSALSYARRYGLMSMLSLAAVDDDGAAASGTVVAAAKSAPTGGVKPSFSRKAVAGATGDDI